MTVVPDLFAVFHREQRGRRACNARIQHKNWTHVRQPLRYER